jgi:hypothetical protein
MRHQFKSTCISISETFRSCPIHLLQLTTTRLNLREMHTPGLWRHWYLPRMLKRIAEADVERRRAAIPASRGTAIIITGILDIFYHIIHFRIPDFYFGF